MVIVWVKEADNDTTQAISDHLKEVSKDISPKPFPHKLLLGQNVFLYVESSIEK